MFGANKAKRKTFTCAKLAAKAKLRRLTSHLQALLSLPRCRLQTQQVVRVCGSSTQTDAAKCAALRRPAKRNLKWLCVLRLALLSTICALIKARNFSRLSSELGASFAWRDAQVSIREFAQIKLLRKSRDNKMIKVVSMLQISSLVSSAQLTLRATFASCFSNCAQRANQLQKRRPNESRPSFDFGAVVFVPLFVNSHLRQFRSSAFARRFAAPPQHKLTGAWFATSQALVSWRRAAIRQSDTSRSETQSRSANWNISHLLCFLLLSSSRNSSKRASLAVLDLQFGCNFPFKRRNMRQLQCVTKFDSKFGVCLQFRRAKWKHFCAL